MLELLIVLSCLILNAFFSAYEMAFVTITKEEINDLEESRTFKALIAFKKKPERTLSVIQIGITLVGAIAAAVGGTGAVENLEPVIIQKYNLSQSTAEALSVIMVILPLTYFSVVFGELLPKTLALKHPKKILVFGTNILGLIDKGLSPIVTFLEFSTHYLLKLLRIDGSLGEDESLGQSIEIGNLADYHQKFVTNLISLKGKRVLKSMILWNKVTSLNFSDSEEEVRKKVNSTPHSRFPVIDSDVVVGILHRKELREIPEYIEHHPWQGNLRPAVITQENEKVLEAFLKMQNKQSPLSVVLNQKNEIIGIITIEDIIEEIVGDIRDRSDYSNASRVLANRPRIRLNTKSNNLNSSHRN
jgi:putative hemolysin